MEKVGYLDGRRISPVSREQMPLTIRMPGIHKYPHHFLASVTEFAKQTAPFQYPDGPVIAVQSENEYLTSATAGIPGLDEHMQAIIDTLRSSGLTKIPIIHNDRGADGQYAYPGLGEVDLYGWDGYPLGFNCDTPSEWVELSTQFDTSHQTINPSEPLAMFEWQGGAFSYWSGPGYSECYQLVNEQFANVFYKNNYASGVALQNLYMTYGANVFHTQRSRHQGSPYLAGGTNWGNLQTHTIYSSYDYGSAIREDRTLTPKLDELKLQASFLHASPDYLLVGRIGNGTVGDGTAYSTSADIYTTHLNSPSSGANFYIVRQVTNTKITDTDFTLSVNVSSAGEITIPKSGNLTLAGRESKIIVTNYPFGSSKLQYSTAEIDTLVAYALAGQTVEIVVENPNGSPVTTLGASSITAVAEGQTVTISGSPLDVTVVTFNTTRIIVADKQTAYSFWAPRLAVSGTGHDHYDASPDVASVLVKGPYLLRSASAQGSTLQLTGDLNVTTTIDIFAPSTFTAVTWNSEPLPVTKSNIGSLRGSVALPADLSSVDLPVLNQLDWKCADSLPELSLEYDDSNWVLANKTSTLRPQQPTAGKIRIPLRTMGVAWSLQRQCNWSRAFDSGAYRLSADSPLAILLSSTLTSLDLVREVRTARKAWIYFHLRLTLRAINYCQERMASEASADDHACLDNINDEFKTPRGIRGYTLLSDNGNDFTHWRVAGNIGGENAPDTVRGPYNEGGWWYERVGAHLPGFDDSKWSTCSPYEGRTSQGVTVYRTTFNLDLPRGADIPLAFDMELDTVNPHRVLIWVNGWQFGRFISSSGPQTSFPVPEGILNHHGQNEVLISLWALDSQGANLTQLELNPTAVLSSSKAATIDIVPAPGWQELRGNIVTS
ncbi:hypothetical protein H0H92_004635 [Tricholoma furcatifolium]|nr:hypothetical protein H0H92_004635 [Tricholoma furcatifolium]